MEIRVTRIRDQARGRCLNFIYHVRIFGNGARHAIIYPQLRRAEAVEAVGIIGPLRIAEIGRAGRERVGLHRLPNGIGEVRASVNNHCLTVLEHGNFLEFLRGGWWLHQHSPG